MSFPSAFTNLPALSNLAVNTERNGARHWTECTQSSCIMAVHNWRPSVPVTNAERDALDATPPHKPLTGTTVRERDACLVNRYGWAGLRASSWDNLYSLLAAGGVGQFPGSGDYPGVTDFKGDHGLAIGPANAGRVWVRDPLHTAGHWAPWGDVVSWCWGYEQVAVYPAADPSQTFGPLAPLLGIGSQPQTAPTTPQAAPGTAPLRAASAASSTVSDVSVAPGNGETPLAVPVASEQPNWGAVALAAGIVVLTIMATRKAD